MVKPEKWFEETLKAFENDKEFRLETIVLDITERVSERMKEMGISRVKLAKLLNVSPPAVTRILNGNSNFTLKTLLSLADALDLELRVVFSEKTAKREVAIPSDDLSIPKGGSTLTAATYFGVQENSADSTFPMLEAA